MEAKASTTKSKNRRYYFVTLDEKLPYITDDEYAIANKIGMPINTYYELIAQYGAVSLEGRSQSYMYFKYKKQVDAFINDVVMPYIVAKKLVANS